MLVCTERSQRWCGEGGGGGGGSARRGGRIRLPSLLSLPAGDNGALAAGVDGDTGPPLRAGALLLPVGWLCASPNHMTCNTPTPPTGSLCVCVCVYLRCVQCRIWITFRTMHSFFRFCCPAVPSSGGEDEHLSLFIQLLSSRLLRLNGCTASSYDFFFFTLFSLLMCQSRCCLSTTNNFAAE